MIHPILQEKHLALHRIPMRVEKKICPTLFHKRRYAFRNKRADVSQKKPLRSEKIAGAIVLSRSRALYQHSLLCQPIVAMFAQVVSSLLLICQ